MDHVYFLKNGEIEFHKLLEGSRTLFMTISKFKGGFNKDIHLGDTFYLIDGKNGQGAKARSFVKDIFQIEKLTAKQIDKIMDDFRGRLIQVENHAKFIPGRKCISIVEIEKPVVSEKLLFRKESKDKDMHMPAEKRDKAIEKEF